MHHSAYCKPLRRRGDVERHHNVWCLSRGRAFCSLREVLTAVSYGWKCLCTVGKYNILFPNGFKNSSRTIPGSSWQHLWHKCKKILTSQRKKTLCTVEVNETNFWRPYKHKCEDYDFIKAFTFKRC